MNSYLINPNQSGREIGIFWDFDSFRDQSSFKLGSYAAEAVQISNSILLNGFVSCSKIFGRFPSLENDLCNIFRSNGFEIYNSDGSLTKKDLITSIILWLWDVEIKNKNSGHSCVVLISNDTEYDYILSEIRKRSVYVTTICDDASNIDKWNKVSDIVRIFGESTIPFNYFTDEKNDNKQETRSYGQLETNVPLKSSNSRPSLDVEISYVKDPRTQMTSINNNLSESEQNMFNNDVANKITDIVRTFSSTSTIPLNYLVDRGQETISNERSTFENSSFSQPLHIESNTLLTTTDALANLNFVNYHPRNSTNVERSVSNETIDQDQNICSNDEQRNLLNELTLSIISHNVQGTVSKLRKIYTRQYRGFRIPAILANISLQIDNVFENKRVVNYAEMTHILGCIQWCFGGQKGDNIDSFTYKMNKNIARWLLKDLQRKFIPNTLLEEMVSVAILTVQNILKIVTEFEYCLELLQFFAVKDPMSVIIPQLYLWGMSSNPSQVIRAQEFAGLIGIPPLVFAGKVAAEKNAMMSPKQRVSEYEIDFEYQVPRFEVRPPPAIASANSAMPVPPLLQTNRPTKVLNFHQQVTNILSMHSIGLSAKQILDICYHEYGRSLQVDSERLDIILQSKIVFH